MELFVLSLLFAGSMGMLVNSNKYNREKTHRTDNIELSTPYPSTSIADVTTDDPCYSCRNIPISITDTWAGQCFVDGEGATCNCVCADRFCFNGEVIDRLTCTPNGRLKDCRCISISTIPPTTVSPTSVPFVGCEWCLNNKLSVADTFAGHCFPNPSNGQCSCLCADIFCKNGQVIDRTTCVNGGSIDDCRCIDESLPSTTSTPIPGMGF